MGFCLLCRSLLVAFSNGCASHVIITIEIEVIRSFIYIVVLFHIVISLFIVVLCCFDVFEHVLYLCLCSLVAWIMRGLRITKSLETKQSHIYICSSIYIFIY